MKPESREGPNTYFDNHLKTEAVKILPGEYYVSSRDIVIVTVLGSCVSACIRDKTTGVGGMNHFMLPGEQRAESGMLSESARYGAYAMEILINDILKAGGTKPRLEAKIFGGGKVIKDMSTANIGEKNVEFVSRFLALENIPVLAHDVLDIYPRKVYFFPKTGRVLVKRLKTVHNDTIGMRETEYRSRLSRQQVSGEVDLF